jgi:hypothetical protein
MHLKNSRVIVGVSKEKSLAAEEHKNALRAGKVSGLVDWATDDGLLRYSLCEY